MATEYTGATLFDGMNLVPTGHIRVENGVVTGPGAADRVTLDGGYLLPGLLDLQVNGGGGLMVCGSTSVDDLRRICDVQARLGATGILPTLITDRPEATAAVIAAGVAAARAQVPGFLGLHLEGPHLDPRRKGAHDAALIRPMTDADLAILCQAARDLPSLMVTVAPESVSVAKISALRAAGAVVSLGHTDCTAQAAQGAIAAGAGCVTHLFNAMSQLGNREPGLVGAALTGRAFCGLIADGIHVAAEAVRIATAARPEGIFLVTDCMAAAGTEATEFRLGGRRILRREGRLTLEDGTLAGADLTLPQAMRFMAERVGLPLERVFAMATRIPADCLGRNDIGRLVPGARADFVHLGPDLSLRGVWRAGKRIH